MKGPAQDRNAESVPGVPPVESMSGPGNAELQLGVHLGWYSRGYLPHNDHPGLLQFITYRLADSLPKVVREQVEAELKSIPHTQQDAERRKRQQAWLDAGRGSCVLRRPEAAQCVMDAWQCFAGERYDLIAWVVMPNHVHVLIRCYTGEPLGKIVQSWKSYTGKQIRLLLGATAPHRVWMREYWDRYIRNERHFNAVVAYIHENPVKAGLVERAEDWAWSSAREWAEDESGARGTHAELELGVPRAEGEL